MYINRIKGNKLTIYILKNDNMLPNLGGYPIIISFKNQQESLFDMIVGY